MKKKTITEKENQELELELVKGFGKGIWLDGILNLTEYNRTTPKILWILKEGNWGDDFHGNKDDTEKLSLEDAKEILINKQKMKNDYYSDITQPHKPGYNGWKATFKNIMYITHGIIENIYKWDDMSNITMNCKIDDKYYMDNIAFINIKRAVGSSNAINNLVQDSYNKHKELLFKQIEIINPDIIFNCSRIDKVMTDFMPDTPKNTTDFYFDFAHDKKRLFINTYHPMQTKIKHNIYVDNNLEIIKHFTDN